MSISKTVLDKKSAISIRSWLETKLELYSLRSKSYPFIRASLDNETMNIHCEVLFDHRIKKDRMGNDFCFSVARQLEREIVSLLKDIPELMGDFDIKSDLSIEYLIDHGNGSVVFGRYTDGKVVFL